MRPRARLLTGWPTRERVLAEVPACTLQTGEPLDPGRIDDREDSDVATFSGSRPAFYDQYLGPLIFEPYGRHLARLVAAGHPERVLELAAGTGRLTVPLRKALPKTSTLMATDLSTDMLSIARHKVAARNTQFLDVDAHDLPFGADSFDAVVCQFGAMFFSSRPKALLESKRVMAPGATLWWTTWCEPARNPLVEVVLDVLGQRLPPDQAADLGVPFSLHQPAELAAWFKDAGLVDVDVQRVELPCVAPSALDAASGYLLGRFRLLDDDDNDALAVEGLLAELSAAIEERFGPPVRPGRGGRKVPSAVSTTMTALVCRGRRP